MRYPDEHKERTRRRILREARRLFRAHGYHGVGVDRIMAAAGLTHGGFYGHFDSKAALFGEALGEGHDLLERLRARPGRSRARLAAQGLATLRAYLAPENRERVGRGCSMASLAADAARGPGAARTAFADAVRELADELARGLERPRPDDPRALAALATAIGGLTLARAVGDPDLADAISKASTRAVERELRR